MSRLSTVDEGSESMAVDSDSEVPSAESVGGEGEDTGKKRQWKNEGPKPNRPGKTSGDTSRKPGPRPNKPGPPQSPMFVPGHIPPPAKEFVFVPPSSIFFTERSIPAQFSDGSSLQETFDRIAKREIRKRDLPIIDVVWAAGCLWSLDNRRLAVFSELHRRSFAKVVKVKIVPANDNLKPKLDPFIKFWQRFPGGERPWPNGLPDGWGGDAPKFSPVVHGDVKLVPPPSMSIDAPAVNAPTANGSMPPLVKYASSEDELSGKPASPPKKQKTDGAPLKNKDPAPEPKPDYEPRYAPLVTSDVEEDRRCRCDSVINVINVGKVIRPLSTYYLSKRPQPLVHVHPKPKDLEGFVCGCGHKEDTLDGLGKHKDRHGHGCWSNDSYDSLRDLVLNEDLRINCMGHGSA